MSTLQIVGKEFYLKHIFGDGFTFFIPRYQRPYAWSTEETEELLDDLWTAHVSDESPVHNKDPYFLGSIVLIKEEWRQLAVLPPLTRMICPVMKDARAEARKVMASAISWGLAPRLSGTAA